MKTPILVALLAAAVSAGAQPGLAPPQIGYLVDGSGSLRPVFGLAGNFVVGERARAEVISAAFTDAFGLVKTNSAILVADRNAQPIRAVKTGGGPALFAFSGDGRPALAYLLSSNELLRYDGFNRFRPAPFDAALLRANAVLSVAEPDARHADLLVQRDDGLWNIRVVLATGEVDSQSALPGLTAPAFLLANGGVLSSDAQGLVIRKPDGTEVHIAAQLPAQFSFTQLGHGWLELRDIRGPRFAVRVIENHEAVFALPEVRE